MSVSFSDMGNGVRLIRFSGQSATQSFSRTFLPEIAKAIDSGLSSPDVRALILTGEGKFFSAGASIQMLNSVSPGFKYNFCLHANETLSRLEQTSKLVICAINGHAVGGGLEIAMAADIRIARKNSGKVGLPEINLGVLAGTGGTARLTRLIGKAKALEMMVTGELMSFEDAHGCNLINHIWEGSAEDFRRDILDWCSQFTLPNKAVKAVGNIKRSCQTGPEIPFEYHLALERELQAALFNSSDAKEGIAAYVEKRVANFTGQ